MIVRKVQDQEIRMIHEKSLEILEKVGVNFENREILDFFQKAGIRTQGSRVFFTRDQVENARKTLKSSFIPEDAFCKTKDRRRRKGSSYCLRRYGYFKRWKDPDACDGRLH